MIFRRSITTVGTVALVGFALPVITAAPAEAAPCTILSPCPEPVTKIVATSGTPLEAGPFAETSSRTATFDITVDPADTSVTYECKLEKDTTIVSDWASCTTPAAEGQPSLGSVTYTSLSTGSYKFSARATKEPDAPLATRTPDGSPDVFLWDVIEAPPGPVEGAPDTVLSSTPSFWLTQDWFSVDVRAASDEPLAEAECKLDGRVVTKYCSARQWDYFAARPGDHKLSVAVTDLEGIQDPTPAAVRFNVPRSAVQLTGLRGFKRATGRGYMLDQYVYATRKGASITRKFTGMKQVAVVVTKGPHLGSLKVYIGKTLVKTIRLNSSRVQHRKVVVVKKSTKTFRGPLRIVAVSRARVIVEAVGLSAR